MAKSRAAAIVAAVLRRAALRLSGVALRINSRQISAPAADFYPAGPGCQVPHLSLLLERIFGRIQTGAFVEVGAFDGISHSNSWGLAERGWTGLYIEPDPDLARACASNHAGHEAIRVINIAAGPAGVRSATLHRNGTLSTLSSAMHEAYGSIEWARSSLSTETVDVAVETLDNILSENRVLPEFELLIVDTEGYEEQVLAGFSISKWRPKVIIIELADFHPDLSHRHELDHALYLSLLAQGYTPVFKDAINTILVESSLHRDGMRTVEAV